LLFISIQIQPTTVNLIIYICRQTAWYQGHWLRC